MNRSQRGTVLILALLVFASTVTLGLAFLESSTHAIGIQSQSLVRLQARSGAESALQLAFRALRNNPATRGQTVIDGVGSFEIAAYSAGVLITASHEIDGVAQSLQSYCTFEVESDWPAPLLGVTSVDIDPAMRVSSPGGVVADAPVTVDASGAGLGALVDGVVNLLGNLLGAGGVILKGRVTVEGLVVIDGDLQINGQNEDVSLIHGADSYEVLIVKGNLQVHNVQALNIRGVIVAEGNVHFNNVDKLTGRGMIFSNGDLRLNNITEGTWEWDEKMVVDGLPHVSGGSSHTTVIEEWRRPYPGS